MSLIGPSPVFLFLIILVPAAPLSINFTGMLNFDLAPVTSFSHRLVYTPQPRDGPMSITLEFIKMRTSKEGSLTPVVGHTQKAEWRNESAKAKGFDGFFSG